MIHHITPLKIFYSGSKTFFTASLFFPKKIKKDVFDLYAFVRTADNFVDSVPQQVAQFQKFKAEYYAALKANGGENLIIQNFVSLQTVYGFNQQWVDAFFESMEKDIFVSSYETIEDTLKYIYGSAEVVGLMMAKIMHLSEESYAYAAMLGRAFQFMNMIRDIKEDLDLNRSYLPKREYQSLGLETLTERAASQNTKAFETFVRKQSERYWNYRNESKEGFRMIPRQYRIPITAAAREFDRTVSKIEKNPMIIWRGKHAVSVSRTRIVYSIIKQTLTNHE